MPGPDTTPKTGRMTDWRNIALLVAVPLVIVLAIVAVYFYRN